MTVTTTKLRAQARKLDRLNGKATTVLAAMERGEALLLEYRWCNPVWCLSGGRHIPDDVARIVVNSNNVINVGNTLFDEIPAQTYRWVED